MVHYVTALTPIFGSTDIQSKHRTINDNQLVLEKSLHHTFLMLEKMGFQRSLIKEALSQISSKTLEGALEWICLNAPTEALPNGFYDKIIYEQDAIVQVTPAASKVTLSENASKENIEPKRVFDEKIPDLKYLSIKVSASAESIQAEKVLDMDALARDADLKARILASAERMKEQEDKAKEAKLAIRTKAYDEYIHLSLNLHRARAKSSPDAPKEIRSKMGRYIHESSQRIKMVLVPVMHAWLEKADKRVQELWEDEKDFELDPEIPEPAQLQAVEKPLQIQAATKENVVVESDSSKIESQQDAKEDHESKAEDEDDGVPLMGSMFEENQESQPPIGSTTTSTGTIMDLTYPGWAPRMSPKDLFDEWVGKNVPGGRITISPLKQTSIGYRAELKLSSQKADAKIFCMEESEQATTKMDAKHYVSIKALFELAPKYQVQNRLPPPYRDLWRDWTEKVEAENNQAIHILNVDRIEFINELLKSLPGSRRPSVSSKTNDETIAPQSPDTVGRDTQAKNSLSDAYWNVMQQRKPSPGYQSLLAVRRTLPVFNAREEILEQVKSHQVVVIAGETGSGKSTQVPQFLLEDAIEHKQAGSVNILCTQPRRISATSLATRVSQEMGDRKGQVGKPESFVGYQVRMENCTSKTTRLTYCTTVSSIIGFPVVYTRSHHS